VPHRPNETLATTLSPTARARLRRVLRRPELQAAVRSASELGSRVWLVGGAIRDVLLARPVAEHDLAVSNDPDRLAGALTAAGFGTTVLLSDQNPRVYRVAGARDLDIAQIAGGSIEADLARRDFTVNAIACTLPGGDLIDPFGGIEDLAARRLRAVSEKNLLDDPLRVLRAARLMATHGLEPDRELTEGSRRAASGLTGAAGERVRTEFVKLLASERVAGSLAWLTSARALAPVLAFDAARARRFSGKRGLLRLDEGSVRRTPPSSRVLIRLALIADRAGLSPAEAGAWLRSRRFSRSEAGEVAVLLELSWRASRIRSSREEWQWIADAGSRRTDAAALVSVLRPDRRRLANRLARPLPRRRVRVRGADLLDWLAIPPGPIVGRLLREVEIEILRGAIRSRRDARRWLVLRQAARPKVPKSRGPKV
jgi:tRNA nucleotidyltransferase/poly(A) polymerase